MASSDSEMAVLADYKSSLNDLDCNSKPMINVLTMLAEENQPFANGIVKIIKERILESAMKIKLPSLYLLDSILKNVGGAFIDIISMNMIEIFTNVFDKGDERIRVSLYKLRNTWPQYFPTAFLHQLDMAVRELDPNWPVVEIPHPSGSIHINPIFLFKEQSSSGVSENISVRDPSKLKVQKEQLIAEEQRIQDQLKKLKEEQQRLVASKEEEERISRERFMRKQQLEREQMIREQQKQIMALRKMQEEQEKSLHRTVKKTGKIIESDLLQRSKQSDPRLPKEEPKHQKLEVQAKGVTVENNELIGNAKNTEKNQMQTVVMAQNNSIEQYGEEPVAKKRRSDDGVQEFLKAEQSLALSDKVSKAIECSEEESSENSSSTTGVLFQKEEKFKSISDKIKIEGTFPSSENENRPTVKNHNILAEVNHENTRYEPLDAASSSKRMHESPAIVTLDDRPMLAPASPSAERNCEVPLMAPNVTEIDKDSSIVETKRDKSLILSTIDSKISEKTTLATSEGDGMDKVLDKSLGSRNGKTWDKAGREIDEEAVNKSRYGSTKVFHQKLEQQAIDRKDIASRAGANQKSHYKEMLIESHRTVSRNSDDRWQRPEHIRNEQQISSRQQYPRARGGSFRGRGNRRTPPLDSSQISQPNEHVTDNRPPWRRPMERPGMRRTLRPYRGIDNDSENKRLPRENRRMNFYRGRPPFKGLLSGSSGGPPNRLKRYDFDNERHNSREAFGIPQRSENRHSDDVVYRNPQFEESRSFHADEKYFHESDFYNPRTNQLERRERLPLPERGFRKFEHEARTFDPGYSRMQFENESDMRLSGEESLPHAEVRFRPDERFLRENENNRPYEERSIPRDSEHLTNRFDLRDDGFSHRNHTYVPRYIGNEDRFERTYQDPAEKQYGDHLKSNNLESNMNEKEDQQSYGFDGLTSKSGPFLQVGNVDGDDKGRHNMADKDNTANFTNSSSLMEMIRNVKQGSESLSKKDEPPAAETSQSQRQEASNGIKKLFEGLVSAGVLRTAVFDNETAPSPPPNIETSEDEIPKIGFVMEQLKTRHHSVINKLYSGAQCSACSLRFTQDDKKFYRDHLDWHFRNNRIGRDGKRCSSRTWYHYKEVWMDMDDVTDFEEQAKSAVFELERKIQDPVDSESSRSCAVLREDEVCNICFEPFEQFWDEPLEEWRYNDAIRIEGQAYHVNCYDDLKTGNNSEQEVSADEMNTELIGDSFGKHHEDLATAVLYMDPKPDLIGHNSVSSNDVGRNEVIKMSQNGKPVEESNNIANQNTKNSLENNPKPSVDLCSANNLSDDLKIKDENEIT